MAKKNTVESKVAQTILQESKSIEVGGKTYEVAPPSLATLIKVSELVSQMPEIDTQTDDPITEALRVAKDSSVIADILATVILGAKRIKNFKHFIKIWTLGLIGEKDEYDKLRESLMYDKTPKELSDILTDALVNRMDVGFFFGISTSLSGVNMTKPTKETTVRGQ